MYFIGQVGSNSAVIGRDGRRGRHGGMVVLGLAGGALARQAMRAAWLLRAEELGSIKRQSNARVQAWVLAAARPPLEPVEAAAGSQLAHNLVETGLRQRGVRRIEHRANVIVRPDFRHA